MVDSWQIEDWERAADQPDMPVELIRRLTAGGRDLFTQGALEPATKR